ncbi:MAG: hypothetical protein ACPGTU_14225 [Myxococcota bacterium]
MRQQLQLLLLTVLVMALGLAGYRLLFGEKQGERLVVVAAEQATVSRSGSGADELSAGMVLDVQDTIRTAKDGSAQLKFGTGAGLVLSADGSMRILSADGSGLRVELEEGAVSARVRPGMAPLGITNRGRAVRATDADFTVMVDSAGGLSAAPDRGSLALSGFGELEELGAGDVLRAVPNKKAVSAPAPEKLLLDVNWPTTTTTRSAEVVVEGRTDPYAMVIVGEGEQRVQMRADINGHFQASVPLKEGENGLELTVRDVMGREVIQKRKVNRDSTAPIVQGAEVVWGP